MGSVSFRANPEVIQVTPAVAVVGPDSDSGVGSSQSLLPAKGSRARSNSQRAFHCRTTDLPPLKETLYLSCAEVPRAISFDVTLDNGEASIIKKHPPRRLQRLEALKPVAVSGEQWRAANAQKTQSLDRQAETAKQFSRRRHHVHQIQHHDKKQSKQKAIGLQEQLELRNEVHQRARISKQIKHDPGAVDSEEKNQSTDHQRDQYYIGVEHDETFNMDYDSLWPSLTSSMYLTSGRGGTLEGLVQPRHRRDTHSWSSSSDSTDTWGEGTGQAQRRLLRTKVEKIPIFDDFFDQEL